MSSGSRSRGGRGDMSSGTRTRSRGEGGHVLGDGVDARDELVGVVAAEGGPVLVTGGGM